jgi:hypothetical protein
VALDATIGQPREMTCAIRIFDFGAKRMSIHAEQRVGFGNMGCEFVFFDPASSEEFF